MSKSLVGTLFVVGSTPYKIDQVQRIDPELTAMIKALESSGKDPAMYFASKVLKSGKPSKQGGMFYRFTASGHFVKVL